MIGKMLTQDLLDAVQEHIDAHYNPALSIESDGINWLDAEKSAHKALDKIVGVDLVDKAIAWFK